MSSVIDPVVAARVLREIEAEVRQIHRATPYAEGHVCVTCLDPATLSSEIWPCPTLRLVRRMVTTARVRGR